MKRLKEWENVFSEALQKIEEAERKKAGALLHVIPDREEWEQFLESARNEWSVWSGNPQHFPCSLMLLYGGVAFYEYYAREFWPQFQEAVDDNLSASQQQDIKEAFAIVATRHGFKIRERRKSTDYVGSAVHHIGIPISLWDEFLEVCEWALLTPAWNEFSEEQWLKFADKRSQGRNRLKNFLVDNRDTASEFIKEMLEAREILVKDRNLTINQLGQASLLRREYFEEVPETAEFLRPRDPESLIRDRPQLVWYEDRECICLHLPGVPSDKLPAEWEVGTITQNAASTPDTLVLNSKAFSPSLTLHLKSGRETEKQRLQGIFPWGLFDLERKRFVNVRREQLPRSSYVVVSPEPLDEICRTGFDEEDFPENELYELEDGTECYVTYLYPDPAAARPKLSINGKKIDFWTRSKIEARIFAGEGSCSANFRYDRGYIKLEYLPLICMSVPLGFFENAEDALRDKFQVCIQGEPVKGIWNKRHEDEKRDREFFFWNWETDLQPKKKVKISVEARGLGIEFDDYQVEMLRIKDGTEHCWQNLPGRFLPWFLLAQPRFTKTEEGMTHSDLLLAKDAIAPDDQQRLSMYLLRKCANYGLLKQKGNRWIIAESRAVFEAPLDGKCTLRYCGNPALLWRLIRYMADSVPSLPVVEVIAKRGEPPYLTMEWKEESRDKVREYLEKRCGVCFVSDLWGES